MSQSAVQSFYRYHAYVYDFTRWTILHGRAGAVARLNLQPDSRVLEVGCGTGLNFRFVRRYLDPARGQLTGLDFSEDMLRVAERRVRDRGWTNVELIQADASAMQLGRSFDAVFFAYSLTMIPDWKGAIDRAVEHLRPGGRLVVLDFGRFQKWGPLGGLMRGWLRSNHVETLNVFELKLAEVLQDFEVSYWLGGYNFTATGTKKN